MSAYQRRGRKLLGRRVTPKIGDRFGLLSVVAVATSATTTEKAECLCDCGNRTSVKIGNLRSGHTRSCGCLETENREHTQFQQVYRFPTSLPEHTVWGKMIDRCTNPGHPSWSNYGARGVRVCERWLASWDNFYEDMGARPSGEHWLDRLDNDGDYRKDNCAWVHRKVNQRHKRTTRWLEFNGQRRSVAEWADVLGVSVKRIDSRLRYGWSVERTLTEESHGSV